MTTCENCDKPKVRHTLGKKNETQTKLCRNCKVLARNAMRNIGTGKRR